MKKKIKYGLIAGVLALFTTATVNAADIHIEGEKYTKIDTNGHKITSHANLSGSAALFINSTFELGKRVWVEYTFEAPEAGMYSVEGVVGRYDAYYSGNIHFSVNGGREFVPVFTKIADYNDWWIEGRPDYCSKYNLGVIRLKKGVNTLRLYIQEQDVKVDLPLYTTIVDYLKLTKTSPAFEISDMYCDTDTANLFVKGENVKIKMEFSNDAPKNSGFEFVLEDVWENEVKSGKVVFAKNSAEYTLNFGNLPVGWYRIKFLSGEFSERLHKEFFFSVVAPRSEVSEYNERFTLDGGVGYTGNWLEKNRLIKSMNKMGIKQVREGGGDPGYTLEDDSYIPSHSGTFNQKLKENGIDGAGGYVYLTWMSYKDLPIDLMRVYNMNKKMASYDYGSEYEIWNEQDGSFLYEPADKYSSFFKAASLGINDGDSDAKASFGGLSGTGTDQFDRLMLANDVMTYSDYYIYHAHIDTGNKKSKVPYPSGKAYGHIIMANAYDNNKPVWMNEGGIHIPVDENGVAYYDAQIAQARYYIVSTAQAMALGDDKRCFFRLGYFMEKGATYGCHTKNMNPHIVVNSIAAFNNVVGKGDYKGEICNLPEGAEGYIFNNGKSDVAVVWCETADVVEFKSDKNVKVYDFVGHETTVKTVDGKVEIPLSYYPVFVTFDNSVAEDEYIPMDRNLQKASRKEYAENERIIIQQIWDNEDLAKAKMNGYTIDWKEEQKVTVKLYNFNTAPQSGVINIKTGSSLVSGDVLVPSSNTINFTIPAMSFSEFPITVKLSEIAKIGDAGYFMIEGKLEDGRELSPSKSRWTTSNKGRVIEDFIPYEGWENPENWDETVVGNCKADISYSETEEALLFELNFSQKSWAWPRITVKDMETTKGSQGLTFKVKNADEGTNNHINVFTYYEDGTDYWLAMDGHMETSDEWTQIVIPWKSFVMFWSALGDVDTRGFKPEYINSIGIGSDSRELLQRFYIKDVGYYFSDLPSDNDTVGEKFDIKGVEEGKTYSSDIGVVTAQIPDNYMKEIKVILNEKDYSDYTFEGNKLMVNLNGLKRGKYTLEIAAFDEWNDVNVNLVNFYIE